MEFTAIYNTLWTHENKAMIAAQTAWDRGMQHITEQSQGLDDDSVAVFMQVVGPRPEVRDSLRDKCVRVINSLCVYSNPEYLNELITNPGSPLEFDFESNNGTFVNQG